MAKGDEGMMGSNMNPMAMTPMGMNPMAMMMMGAAMMGQVMMAGSGTGDMAVQQQKLPAADDDDEEGTGSYGSSFNVNHPNYRPPDMEQIPGVTDKRFVGRIKFWFENKGFGFIESDSRKFSVGTPTSSSTTSKRSTTSEETSSSSVYLPTSEESRKAQSCGKSRRTKQWP